MDLSCVYPRLSFVMSSKSAQVALIAHRNPYAIITLITVRNVTTSSQSELTSLLPVSRNSHELDRYSFVFPIVRGRGVCCI